MAKREIRAVTASEDISAIIDHGYDVDNKIKNLSYEDKGLKLQITNSAKDQLDGDELSVRLLGKTAAVVVSAVEKVDLDVSAEQFPQVREAIDNGILSGIVERTMTLTLPPADVERAAEALTKAGIRSVVTETLKVSSDVLRDQLKTGVTTSLQYADALKALSKCLKRDVSFRVKYERL
jgi:hypothetical protein